MWHSTKRCSLIFDLCALMPKIYSPKLLAITLHYHVATRGRALGTAALPGESRQSTELWGRSLLSWFVYIPVYIYDIPVAFFVLKVPLSILHMGVKLPVHW